MLDLSPHNPVPALGNTSFKSFRTIGVASANRLFARWVMAIPITWPPNLGHPQKDWSKPSTSHRLKLSENAMPWAVAGRSP